MDRDSFIDHVKTEDICKDIAEDVGIRFGTLSFELGRPLPEEEKNEKLIGLVKDEFGGQRIYWIKSKNI